jgi:hypothetical protein
MTEANGFATVTAENVVEPALSGAKYPTTSTGPEDISAAPTLGSPTHDTNRAVEPDTSKLTHEAWDGLSDLI